MYKATIRNNWNKNLAQYFFMVKKDLMIEKGIQNATRVEMSESTTSPVGSPMNIQGFFVYL